MRDDGAGSIIPTRPLAGNKTESSKGPTGSPNSTLTIALPVCIVVVALGLLVLSWYSRSGKQSNALLA